MVLWLLKTRPPHIAIFMAITFAGLLLPLKFSVDFPLVPPIDKDVITPFFLVIFLFLSNKKFQIFKPSIVTSLILIYLAVCIVSIEQNTSPVMIGGRLLPGLTQYDAFSSVARNLLEFMPFFLGRHFLSNTKDTEAIFKIWVTAGLFYTLPMLLELRITPQIHNMLYGYTTVDFIQQMRDGGFRPVVLVGHGLSLAFWFSTCIIAAYALNKNKVSVRFLSGTMLICYLIIVLILCKTWSAIAYVVLAIFLAAKLQPNKQIKWALLLSTLVLVYPISKTSGIIPDREIISKISEFNPDRAQSLEFRFQNEDLILKHSLEKPYFGWNGWGRNRVYDEYGKDISVTDGRWIIEISTNGIIGFIFSYAILLMPLYYALKSVNKIEEPKEKVYFASLALILAVGIMDSIPNANMMPIHFLLAGALLGQAERVSKQKHLNDYSKKYAKNV